MMTPLPFPRVVHIPGIGNEPDRETLEAVKALVPLRLAGHVPSDHPALAYGLALNDAGFFWECHEILEAVWKAAPQGGRDRILLRALIQIANGNLKQIMNQPRAVARLFGEALTELDELSMRKNHEGGFAANYPAESLAAVLRSRLADPGDNTPVMLISHGFI